MAALFFWVTFLIFLGLSSYQIIAKKNYFGLHTYLLLGIYLPILLLFAGWSSLAEKTIDDVFYFLFAELGIVAGFFVLIEPETGTAQLKIVQLGKSKTIVVISFVYCLLCLLENYIGSGYLLPSLAHVDIHTYRAPLLGFLTKAGFFPVCCINVYAVMANGSIRRKALHLGVICAILVLYVFGKSARMEVCIIALQLVSVCIFFSLRSPKRRRVNTIPKKYIVLVLVGVCAIGAVFVASGANRASQFGAYDVLSYADAIGYQGPDFLRDASAWYYGYFPMSFNNLNLSIKFVEPHYNFLGVDLFRFLYYGIFQLDNFLDFNIYAAEEAGKYVSDQMAVKTGFWDIYYNYGLASFVVFALAFAVYHKMKVGIESAQPKIWQISFYFYWVPTWFFMSFQNTSFDVYLIGILAILYVLTTRLFKLKVVSDSKLLSKDEKRPDSLYAIGANRAPVDKFGSRKRNSYISSVWRKQ